MTDTQTAAPVKRELTARLAVLCQQAADKRQERINAKNAAAVAELQAAVQEHFAPLLLDELKPDYRYIRAVNNHGPLAIFHAGTQVFALQWYSARTEQRWVDDDRQEDYTVPGYFSLVELSVGTNWRDQKPQLFATAIAHTNYGMEDDMTIDEWLLLQLGRKLGLTQEPPAVEEDMPF